MKSNGEELSFDQADQTYGTPFDLSQDTAGHYHTVNDHGVDHDWGTNPLDDQPAENSIELSSGDSENIAEYKKEK